MGKENKFKNLKVPSFMLFLCFCLFFFYFIAILHFDSNLWEILFHILCTHTDFFQYERYSNLLFQKKDKENRFKNLKTPKLYVIFKLL